jgi:hypothetical protein
VLFIWGIRRHQHPVRVLVHEFAKSTLDNLAVVKAVNVVGRVDFLSTRENRVNTGKFRRLGVQVREKDH